MAGCYEGYQDCLGGIFGALRTYLPCVCFICPYPWTYVSTGSVGIRKHFGKFVEKVEPGLAYFNPLTENITEVSLKTTILDIKGQKVFTRDNIAVNIDTVVFFKVFDPEKAVFEITNISQSVLEVSYATLRAISGEFTLSELLEERMKVSKAFQNFIEKEVYNWGITIDHILILDMKLNPEIERNLSITARTKRRVESKIISAEADVKAAKMMKEAAEILNTKAAVQIRYLNSISMVADEKGKKWMVVPLNFDEMAEHL